MTAPDVDVGALEEELGRARALVDRGDAAVAALESDLRFVTKLVEEKVRELANGNNNAPPGDDARDTLDPMRDAHVETLATLEADDATTAAFHEHAHACKVAMSACAHRQLRSISAMQVSIRDMRNKQVAFTEVAARQENAFRELRVARRLPRVYAASLAEVARRRARAEEFASRASALSDAMRRRREREMATRETFARATARYLPSDVVEALGLNSPARASSG